ncbi:MAG: Na/Pi cotransporter family protein, partial [Alphaproteobacteria bacterium HGW-Alphaproteobacteria-6]
MTQAILQILGGIGLFLFGMEMMTGALRDLGGPGLRRALARFTTSPVKGALTGAVVTALTQSSSATMVTVIGFVGAGLMAFPQAVGVILGANVGTTLTGWMVTLLGFKLQLGAVALPLLLPAALLRLIGHGRWQRLGAALAGFALIFVGIEAMQAATAGADARLIPALLPPDSWAGRAVLVALGAAVTLVTQSSSAGVAVALALLGAGAIGFAEAAALVIGMDIGTTGTAVLASLGGSRAMRLTGLAHVFYNLLTGTIAFVLLGFVAPLVLGLARGDAQLGLVLFHSGFNLVGALAILPLAGPFARLVERLVPASGDPLGDLPDRRLLSDAGAALDAVGAALSRVADVLFAALAAGLRGRRGVAARAALTLRAEAMLDALEEYLARLVLPSDQPAPLARYVALLHLTDHLHRLAHRLTQGGRMTRLRADPGLRRAGLALAGRLEQGGDAPQEATRLDRLARLIERRMARL